MVFCRFAKYYSIWLNSCNFGEFLKFIPICKNGQIVQTYKISSLNTDSQIIEIEQEPHAKFFRKDEN
jgi:hypothetical protein